MLRSLGVLEVHIHHDGSSQRFWLRRFFDSLGEIRRAIRDYQSMTIENPLFGRLDADSEREVTERGIGKIRGKALSKGSHLGCSPG